MKLWFVLALGIAPTASSHAQEAFQGIQWGATEEQISRSFELSHYQCNDDEKEIDKASPTIFCGGPIVESYPVAGVPFSLSFGLGKTDKRLQAVSLFHSEREQAKAAEQFESIKALLTKKYGPARTSSDNTYGNARRVVSSWMPDRNVITMTWVSMNFDTYGSTLNVSYKPLASREQDKL